MNIAFMKEDALQYLRDNQEKVSKYIKDNKNANLNDFFSKTLGVSDFQNNKWMIPQRFVIDDNIIKGIKLNSNEYNYSKAIYETVKDLPRFILSNPYFWYWFEFTIGYQIARDLTIKPKKNDDDNEGINGIKATWLSIDGKKQMPRRRAIVFNILARLYFRTESLFDLKSEEGKQLASFVNSTRVRELWWREYTNNRKVYVAAVKGEKKYYDEVLSKSKNNKESTKKYLEVAKKVCAIGSAKLIDLLEDEEITDLTYTFMKEAYEY